MKFLINCTKAKQVMINFFVLFVLSSLSANLPSFKGGMGDTAYLGVEYRIPVDLKGNPAEDISVKTSYGNVYKRDDSTFVLSPMEGFNEVKVKLYYRNLICDMKTVEIKRIPEPTMTLSGETGGKISRALLAGEGRLNYQYPESLPKEMRSRIYSFNVMLRDPSGIPLFSGQVRGDKLDKPVLDALAKAPKGVVLVLSNITTISPGNALTRQNNTKEIIIVD